MDFGSLRSQQFSHIKEEKVQVEAAGVTRSSSRFQTREFVIVGPNTSFVCPMLSVRDAVISTHCQNVPKVISLLCSCWSSTQCRSSSAGIYIQSCVTVPDGPELTDSFKTWDHDAGSTLTLLFLCFILLPVVRRTPCLSVYKATVAFVLYSVFQAPTMLYTHLKTCSAAWLMQISDRSITQQHIETACWVNDLTWLLVSDRNWWSVGIVARNHLWGLRGMI